MSRWLTSPYRALTVAVVSLVLTVLALLVVIGGQGVSERNNRCEPAGAYVHDL